MRRAGSANRPSSGIRGGIWAPCYYDERYIVSRSIQIELLLSRMSPRGFSLLRESVMANCSVNLSVSGNGDDDHDDIAGTATSMDPDARHEARADDDGGRRAGWTVGPPAVAAAGRVRARRSGRARPRQPGAAVGGTTRCRAPEPGRRAPADDIWRGQRHPPGRAPRRARGHRYQPAEPPADPPGGRPRQPPPASTAAPPQPPRADGGRGSPPPARRQPPRLARGPGSLADPRRGDRRRDRPSPGGDLPRPGGQRRLSRDPPGDDRRPRPAGGRLPRPPQRLRADLAGSGRARGTTGAQPGRAGPRRARDRLDRRPLAPGQGPDRAAVGHVPGPPRRRAPPGRGDRPGRGERGAGVVPAALQRPVRGAGRGPAGLAAGP